MDDSSLTTPDKHHKTTVKKKKVTKKVKKNIINNNNNNDDESLAGRANGYRSGVNNKQDDVKEEEDVVPDLPVYEDQTPYGGLRKLSRGRSSTDNADSSEEESICEDEMNGVENGYKQDKQGRRSVSVERLDNANSEHHQLRTVVQVIVSGSHDISDAQDESSTHKQNMKRRRGVVEEPTIDGMDTLGDFEGPPMHLPERSRSRRSSTVDLSRSAQKMLLRLSSTGSTGSSLDVSPEPMYCNPEMEIFRQRRLSQQGQPRSRRMSLKDLIPDWPSLDYIEKPEYRMPEFKENESGEAQNLELRKMDLSALYKMDSWIEELSDQTCMEKESKVILTCKFSNTKAKLRWYKNKLEIFHGHKYNFENDNGTFRLIIFRVNVEDTGQYTCATEYKETSAFLTVEERKQSYQFVDGLPETATVKEKGELILECKLSDRKPSVNWRINDAIIEYTPGVYEIFRRETRCILKMRNVQRDLHEAEVSCEVYGDSTLCTLIVDEPEFVFVRHLADVDSYEKETALFECEVNYEEAQVKWLKDDQPLKLSKNKLTTKEEGTLRQLFVYNVCAQDEGIYCCNVQSKHTFAKLYVAPDVVIRERLKDVQKVENENVKLICKVKNPKGHPVTWLKNNKLVSADDRFEVSDREGKSHCLSIKSVQLSDAGTYTCRIGDRHTSATLTVTQCQSAPAVNVDTVPRELLARCGQTISIDIPYTGAPRPVMKWTKNGKVLNNGGSVELCQTADMCFLKVNSARRADSAEYELELTNDSGSEIVPITVKVIGKPQEPEGPLRVVDVHKDHCRLMWEPPLDDGGVNIEYYLVEMQDASLRKWTEVGRVQGDTQCGIPTLIAGKTYKFRVSANNAEGDSDPLATEKEILAKDPWDTPSKPGRPDVVDYDKDRAEIRWNPSENDGGNPIQKYVVEKRLLPGSTWQTIGMVLPEELYAIVPDLEQGKVYEFHVIGVNEAGRGEPSDASDPVCIKSTRVAPTIDRSSFDSEVRLKCGHDITIEVHFSGKPTPVPVWSRLDHQELKKSDNIRTVDTDTSSQLICTNMNRSDTAVYRLTVSNNYGCDTADIDITVIGVPSSPSGPLEVSDVRKSSAVLHWRVPADDGGRPCLNYVVEKLKVGGSGKWERACSSVASNTTLVKVSRLEEGQRYMFRVFAENDRGCGPPLMTELETLAKNPFDAPSAPRPPAIIDSDIDFIKIQWSPPASDGGSAVTGYYVERRDKNTGVWIRLNEDPITGLEYTDRTVKAKKQYEYRVLAENEGGISEPGRESAVAKSRLFKEKGHIEGVVINGASSSSSDGKGRPSVVNLRAGGIIRIDLQISGSPTPVVTWMKDNKPIAFSSRHTEGSDDDKAFLQVSNAVRADSGLYTARVQNEFGFELSSFCINVLDVPSSPQSPHVDQVFSNRCRLSWKPPQDDGGSEVVGYCVELSKDGCSCWQRVTSFATSTCHNIKELQVGCKYKFRIFAENMFGVSQPAETNVILAKDPFDAPSIPGRPEVVDSNNDFIVVKWNRPKDDGGAPIEGYNIERLDPVTNRWIKLNSQLLTTAEFRDRSVQSGKQYQYRVSAVGPAGSSEPSELSAGIKAKPLKASPSVHVAAGAHNIEATIGSTLTINAPITGSPTPTITWFKNGQPLCVSSRVRMCGGEDAACLTIYGVTAEDSGAYSVSVSNAYGQANDVINVNIRGQRQMKRARSAEPQSDRLMYAGSDELTDHSPSFTFPLRNRIIQHGDGVKLLACVNARPPPKITWHRDGRNITHDDKYSISYFVGICSLEIASCKVEDTGKYTCIARNELGEADTSCRLYCS